MSSLSYSKLSQEMLWKLKVLTFASGAIVMALEIATSRILTPVFGSTIYTWGSLIGVILSGLSLGYFLGGRIADKHPKFDKICGIVFSVGLFIVGMPFFASYVVDFSLAIMPISQYTPLLATFLLLMLPSVLLGFVSPYVIKLGTKSLQKVGNMSGNLYSIATVGSIFGTFVTVFVLIPNVTVHQIIFGLGIALITSSLIGLKISPKIIAIGIVTLLIVPWSSFSVSTISHNGMLIFEKETMFSHLDIIEYGDNRSLYLDGLRHSSMNMRDPLDLVIDYTEYFHLGMMFNPAAKDILFVGGGGFSGPKNFLALYPDTKIDVIEIDSDVIDVAKTYFNLETNPRLQIFNDDARKHLSMFDKKYDLIILDAYATNYVPYHLMTHEFFQLLEKRLEPNGVVVSNLIGSIEGNNSPLVRSVYKTMKETFPVSYVFPTEEKPTFIQNIMIVSSNQPYDFDRSLLLELSKNSPVDYLSDELSRQEHFYTGIIATTDVPFLTDQYNPSEVLINPITKNPYLQDLPENQIDEKQHLEYSMNLILGIILTVIAGMWLFYFKKRIWNFN
ncbi:Spermidine synthase protein [Marine Group I thaumarchaeote SCGC RSA3]|uniref:Polyamine aminopropyltransferase n=3 Tax=Marine Group I TaxID=905826 RepID=A0A081RM72_9ARCH|nr:Spermidine synthase protein [Marine Group I thaumarchaeote SCGC AAA799-N04]KFM15902.1 Spermidine synthase protein [Marine Group I thaumarchaeote SCGC AAA799-D11]KFM17468.1 Spermidine synthase protein [Marine Group I thaumarchaeote SCGC RSA3]